jgi:hypothetical protein
VLSGRGLYVRLIILLGESIDYGVSECDREASVKKKSCPLRPVVPMEEAEEEWQRRPEACGRP